MLTDIGVNLTSNQFKTDRDQVITRAMEAGVTTLIITGTNVHHSQAAEQLTRSNPRALYSTAGIHPHHASEYDDQAHADLKALAAHDSVVAIGECGLDFNRNFSPRDAQLECFEAQLQLAAELDMPVFLHQRDAHDDFKRILENYIDKLPGAVAHCFTGEETELDEYIEMDLHIGITGWICDERRGMHLQELVKKIPLERLMIETDAPYLLPRNIKPKPENRRNEPHFLPHVCNTVAQCLGMDSDELAVATSNTARKFFGLPERQG